MSWQRHVRASTIYAILGWLLAGAAPASACPRIAQTSSDYRQALKRAQALPQVKAWQAYVHAHPPAQVALDREPTVLQVKVGKECFTPITFYSDEETHLHRWKTFYVGARTHKVLMESADGDLVSPAASAR